MPLGGTGGALGNALAGAVGAGAAGSFFGQLGSVIASWAPANIQVNPGAMAAVSGAVAGLGSFTVVGTAADLGGQIATALGIPADAALSRATWVSFAQALIDHLTNYGQANGAGLTSGAPVVGGAGTVAFTAPAFAPPLAGVLGVAEPVAAGMLEAFGAALISHIQTNASVVGLSLSGPPMSAPSDGPVVGTGTIA